jgi:hypothetical protein
MSAVDAEEPFVLKQWVRAQMVHQGGRWLVDDLLIKADGDG